MMTWRPHLIGLVCATGLTVSNARAQDPSRQIRFFAAGASGVERWQGYVDRITPDSLFLRVRGTDTTAGFLRSAMHSVERERVVDYERALGVGCLALGVPLGSLGYFGTHDPDSPGLEKVAGALGFVVGCGVGAVGGLIVSGVRSRGWEPWDIGVG